MRTLTTILSPVVSVLLFLGLIFYIALAYFGKAEPPGFELAVVSSIFGGLLFSGAFIGKTSLSKEIQMEVRRIGILYLVATIGFIFLVLFLPMARIEPTGIAYWVIFIIVALGMFGSALLFALATGRLIRIIPQLWSGS
jgi:hypothetical protein